MTRKVVVDYYRRKEVPFRMSGDRQNKILPLLSSFTGKTVLDVGCSSGYIGAMLRKQGNYVVGIDITKRDIAKAKKVLDEAYVFDIECDNLKKLGKEYDFILMTEVLEHLFDPERAVKRLLSILKPGGWILLTTPNFVHVYNRLKILFGIYEYREDTIVNKSHLHFFTCGALEKLITEENLTIVAENHVVFPRTFSFFWKFWPSLFAHQLVFLCRKKNEE